MKTNWKQTVNAHRNDSTVVKLKKKILLNIILWMLGLLAAIGVGCALTILAVKKGWENPSKVVAIAIPWIATAILLALNVIIILGNKIGVVEHNGQTIVFYSGIATNMLYVDGILTTKGGSEDKLRCNLSDDYTVNILFKLVDFDIIITKRGELPVKVEEPVAPIDPKTGQVNTDLVVDIAEESAPISAEQK